MTDEEELVWTRIAGADGEASAVGEMKLCYLLWPIETARAIEAEGGVRSSVMRTLRRRVRRIVRDLRFDWRKPILDSACGYFVTDDPEEINRFCRSRRKRGITSLAVQSVVRKQSVVETGVQELFEFLKSEERRRRRRAERTGEAFVPIDTDGVLSAVSQGLTSFTGETTQETADARR